MRIILRKAVTGIGGPGTVKEVSTGYARNFLLPRGLAEIATAPKLRETESQKAAKAKAVEEKQAQLAGVLGRLSGITLKFKKKATKTGKLFAAVSLDAIADELSKIVRISIEPGMLQAGEPIKSIGEHSVKLVVAPDMLGEFKVTVTEE
ncbi:50S ribosomal protein L9 [candidate division Kazan bacterium RBG_13_50_9]|uniref:Large ribosomal subunit protein bL9 n=1 Tax=candidate division Kazan bacterium RBG_13_50_9 TaxID=1798535 RepID=A0A1F4NRT9_UNCK3|nr:MAG: 50S ribosomal protein L9 [candidate division Kazan bacterium RBG_13_50_9]